MKRLIIIAAVVLVSTFSFGVSAQPPGAPAGSSDKTLEDRDIKGRSIELERVKRDADKEAPKQEKSPELNFAQIKDDFEQIQMIFDVGVVRTYKMTNPINYQKISESAAHIRDRAIRLKSNLFPVKPKKGKDKKEETESAVAVGQSDVKTLIMGLNDSISSFVASAIFKTTKVVDPKDSEKAKLDLESIIAKSSSLSEEAGKLK